jgi:hypothetical protein
VSLADGAGVVLVLLAGDVGNALVTIGTAVGLEMVKLIVLKTLLTLWGVLVVSAST